MSLARCSTITQMAESDRPRADWRRAPAPCELRGLWATGVLLVGLLLLLAATVAQAASLVFQVLDINTAAGHTGSAFADGAPPTNPRTAAPVTAVLSNTLYFAAADGVNGVELWKSDGSTITLVKDINPGPGDSNPSDLTAASAQGLIFFSANDRAHGNELLHSLFLPLVVR